MKSTARKSSHVVMDTQNQRLSTMHASPYMYIHLYESIVVVNFELNYDIVASKPICSKFRWELEIQGECLNTADAESEHDVIVLTCTAIGH